MFFFFKQKTAYEMRISDWSSDVCSSDLDIGHELGLLQYVCHNPVCRCSYQLVCDCERWRASGTHTEDRALEPTIIPTWPSARSSRSPPTSAVAAGTMRSVVDTIWRTGQRSAAGSIRFPPKTGRAHV